MIVGGVWAVPMMTGVFAIVVLLALVWFISKVNHGAARRPRRNWSRAGTSPRPGPPGYNAHAAPCRTLGRDDAADRLREPAHRLVDRRGLRGIPGCRPEHLGGLRLAPAGTTAGADVRTVTRVATGDGQGLGSCATAPRQVAVPSPQNALEFYNTGVVEYAHQYNAGAVLVSPVQHRRCNPPARVEGKLSDQAKGHDPDPVRADVQPRRAAHHRSRAGHGVPGRQVDRPAEDRRGHQRADLVVHGP